ncbi:MAG: TM2 domain-containing protein [Treponema sp.]|jgi:TM2 domain-containing membrane protein YozV|nr:TM2 domain-containing protein [Treponema sp.]
MYSVGIAYLLWLFSGCGALGFHRFYLGKIPTGLLWMFTGGLGMIGSVYDFFTLPGQVREANIRNAIYGAGAKNINNQPAGQPSWRNVDDGEFQIVREKESVERIILKLAKEKKGILTASDVALAAQISMDEAKRDLDALVTKGFAELRVRQSGALVYTIPDFMDKDEPLVDL